MGIVTTQTYDQVNAQEQKEPIIVLEIEGLPFVFSSNKVFTRLRYDDPDFYYDGTYVYDGLRPLASDKQKNLIDRKGSFSTISQKLEQWDGKASIQTFNIKLTDENGLVTKVCTPGQYLDEILNKKVRIFYGFTNISYPDDYLLLFKGYINQVRIGQGNVSFNFTDPSSKRKVILFNDSKSKLTQDLLATDTTIKITSTANLYRTILNAKGLADPGVTIGLVLNGKEIVTFTNANITDINTVTNVQRGQMGTVAQAFSLGDDTNNFIQLIDNPVSIALKTMLSGWNGPWKTGIALRGIVNEDNGLAIKDTITFKQGVDLSRDYGITIGDFIILSSSTIPANNSVFTVADLLNDGRSVLVQEKGILSQENPAGTIDISTLASFRSKYDVYPKTAGLSLTTDDVLVAAHEYNRDVFVPIIFDMKVIGKVDSGKTWIETHLFKPIGAYSLTQGSRISMGITHPPLAVDLTKFIEPKNVIDPKNIVVDRGLNTRFFYNEVFFRYNYDPIKNDYFTTLRVLDSEAQNRMNQVATLQIDVRGLDDTALSAEILNAKAERILQRYRYGAETINLKTFFSVGHTIDGGDIVTLKDDLDPVLKIANTETGERGIRARIMEVQERSIGLSDGTTTLTLLSNNGFSTYDRYGVVAPSSELDPSFIHTPNTIKVQDSFGPKYPGAEYKKWQDYEGSTVKVFNSDYSLSANVIFKLDLSDPYIMHFSTPLPFTPVAGMVVSFENYDETSDLTNETVKATFVHIDSSSAIFSGSSLNVFILNSGLAGRYQAGMLIYVHSSDFTRKSPDVKILSVVGDIITIGSIANGSLHSDLGFVPQAGDIVELAGFKDGGSAYRLI